MFQPSYQLISPLTCLSWHWHRHSPYNSCPSLIQHSLELQPVCPPRCFHRHTCSRPRDCPFTLLIMLSYHWRSLRASFFKENPLLRCLKSDLQLFWIMLLVWSLNWMVCGNGFWLQRYQLCLCSFSSPQRISLTFACLSFDKNQRLNYISYLIKAYQRIQKQSIYDSFRMLLQNIESK